MDIINRGSQCLPVCTKAADNHKPSSASTVIPEQVNRFQVPPDCFYNVFSLSKVAPTEFNGGSAPSKRCTPALSKKVRTKPVAIVSGLPPRPAGSRRIGYQSMPRRHCASRVSLPGMPRVWPLLCCMRSPSSMKLGKTCGLATSVLTPSQSVGSCHRILYGLSEGNRR